MSEIQSIYDELWNRTLPLFQANRCDADPLILEQNDRRRGLTLRARPGPDLVARIEAFTAPLRECVPDQYFTPASDLHLTVMSIINCHEEFRYEALPAAAYVAAIRSCVRKFRIRFRGITASPAGLLLQGFPLTDQLQELRDGLRKEIAAAQLQNTIDARYATRTAHITLMRFRQPQADLNRFVRFISMHRETEFGTMEFRELELVHNDWYHKKDRTEVIETFALN
jgi:2'-5' RNA ligase